MSKYVGHVRPASSETNATMRFPLGSSPFQPLQVEVGNSHRPSRKTLMDEQISKFGPSRGGSTRLGRPHVLPASKDSTIEKLVGTNPNVAGFVSPSLGCWRRSLCCSKTTRWLSETTVIRPLSDVSSVAGPAPNAPRLSQLRPPSADRAQWTRPFTASNASASTRVASSSRPRCRATEGK